MSDIDAVVVDSLKALDPNRPIRDVDIGKQLFPVQQEAPKRVFGGALGAPLI